NGCALIGGETAEMPDIYAEGEFDLAGTVIGVVDRSNILDGSEIREGDVVLGISGNGLHTNGYSLARKVLLSRFGVDEYIPELGMTIGEALLQIHPSYLSVIRLFRSDGGVRGFAHVTGGGIEGNARRILPDGFRLDLDWKSWEWPALFQLIRKEGQIPVKDMRQAFNLGIGLVMVVSPDMRDKALRTSLPGDFGILEIGRIKKNR
ncbi:MAG: phosphoribosylformylglycinamidine cyclo-ligase, partial [Cyclonatronaceae bacterium]